ncbi:hypothetical protein [Sphingomonas daechungensis]|uniref:hypothetical protein n=1 Tax=Sphingomonas daechungensis TaxID=1176646 RepID=UPI003783DA35
MASTRLSISREQFVDQISSDAVPLTVVSFVWDQIEPYYFAPLTPHPEDHLVSDMRIDSDDLSDIVMEFEHQFDRRWLGSWVGPEDPPLAEFAVGLLNSTEPK